jgi:hypothetical protein
MWIDVLTQKQKNFNPKEKTRKVQPPAFKLTLPTSKMNPPRAPYDTLSSQSQWINRQARTLSHPIRIGSIES